MGSLPGPTMRLPGAPPPWRSAIAFESHGVRLGVRSNDARFVARLSPFLPPGRPTSASGGLHALFSVRVHTAAAGERSRDAREPLADVFDGRTCLVRACVSSHALAVLESALRMKVASASPDHVFVHAGVVGWRGRAIVLPGKSRSGKTALVTALVRQGALYLSDEYAALDAAGRVHPFPKLLSIRPPSGCDRHARRCGPAALGGSAGDRPLPVGLVALAVYVPGAAWRPRSLTPGQAALEMLAHTVPARLQPERALDALAAAVSRAALVSGQRGAAEETAVRLLGQLDAAPVSEALS